MDVSSKYVNMCERAEEVQGLRQWEYWNQDLWKQTRDGNFRPGDVYVLDEKVIIFGDTPYPPHETKTYGKSQDMVGYDEGDAFDFEKLTWLPTQDQLQEMVDRPLWQLNFGFIDWLCDTDEGYDEGYIQHHHLSFTSMEQLWLAFVMKEKYNKVWNGAKWIKEEK